MNKKTLISGIYKYIKKYNLSLVFNLILSLINVAMSLYVPILVGNAIDKMIGIGNVNFEGVKLNIINLIIVIILVVISQWLINVLNNRIVFTVVRDMRNDCFHKLEKIKLNYVDTNYYGEIVSRMISDVEQFGEGLLMAFTQFFVGIITIIGTIFLMCKISITITLVIVFVTPLSFFVSKFISQSTFNLFKKQSDMRGKQTSYIEEILGNQNLVQAFSKEEDTSKKFDEYNEEFRKVSLKAIFFSSLTNPSTRAINNIVYVGVTLAGALSVMSNGLSVGQMSCFLSYASQFAKPFNEITGVITELQNSFACAERVLLFLKEKEEPLSNESSKKIDGVKGQFDLKNVCFSYDKSKKLIENFNLSVKSGQNVAIVGPTGCGKTTLINLLMRFYDVDSGEILLDGINIKDLSRQDLRKNIGMVLQDTCLFNGTVKDNIKIGKPDATDEEVIAAAKASFAHNFIKRLPNGYDTVIDQDGDNFSQGEKQLLCISRVMLTIPSILILDEATSSIDTRTEIKIQKAFAKLTKNKTSFIVAHRLSTIKKADIILVMKDGNIIEQGSHNDLIKHGGFYKKLYESSYESV